MSAESDFRYAFWPIRQSAKSNAVIRRVHFHNAEAAREAVDIFERITHGGFYRNDFLNGEGVAIICGVYYKVKK